MRSSRLHAVLCALCVLTPGIVRAQAPAGNQITLALQGIDIDLNEDGSWKAIYAVGVQTVTMPDRRGINNAYVVAEERAKAEIARYFKQNVETGRIYTEAESTLEKTMRARGGSSDSFTTSASRTLSTSLRETFASSASAVLTGVTILERSYDEKREEVTVKVGISRQTIATAQRVRGAMQEAARGGGGSGGGASDPLARQQSETNSRALPTGAAAGATKTFTEARGFARGLHLRTQAEWETYARSRDRPANIPERPDVAYASQWISWKDWLGLDN